MFRRPRGRRPAEAIAIMERIDASPDVPSGIAKTKIRPGSWRVESLASSDCSGGNAGSLFTNFSLGTDAQEATAWGWDSGTDVSGLAVAGNRYG
jgi:hypothetical protein